jgi:RNA-directed DNA polymerase
MQCDLTVSELFQAYYDCRKCKRNTWNALKFEQNLERNLMDLYYELKFNQYHPGRSIMFVITRPKFREVWAADFRDRVVHHVMYNRYSDYFYRRFIFDSYACIPEKGTLRASQRVQKFIRSVSKNHTVAASYLKADVANFFVSINKNILDTLLSKHIVEPWWLHLTRLILHKDPRDNVYIKSPEKLLKKVPRYKSLLNAKEGYGLPIGNLSSQFFANVYLHELDEYVKKELKIKHYARYVDDVVAFDTCGKRLHNLYDKMNTFLKDKLELHFHPNKKHINLTSNGVSFVGYVIRPHSVYVRRTTVNNLYKRTKNLWCFDALRATVNSYFGFLRHVNAYKERKKAVKKLSLKGCWFDGKLTKMVRLGAPSCTLS